MPYIPQDARARLGLPETLVPRTPGELNYLIAVLAQRLIGELGGTSYQNINDAVGAIECAKLELYRRIATPYEDTKIAANGDVFFGRVEACVPLMPFETSPISDLVLNTGTMARLVGAERVQPLPAPDELVNAVVNLER